MKVFLSWSGTSSLDIARKLQKWLPKVIQRAKPFISTNIDKGSRWSIEIATNLETSDFGISCVTSENVSAPWLLFEAGALSKSVSADKLAPILFGIDKGELSGSPLSQFQMTSFNQAEMLQLVSAINRISDGDAISPELLEETFNQFWPELELHVNEAIGSGDVAEEASDAANGTGGSTSTALVTVENEKEKYDAWEILFTKDASKFSEGLSTFRTTDSYLKNIEFWESHFVVRKRELHIGGTGEEWANLAAENSSWVWPLIYLGRDALAAGDYDEADTLFSQAKVRENRDAQEYLNDLGLDIAMARGGVPAGIAFLAENIRAGMPDNSAHSLAKALAANIKKSPDNFFGKGSLVPIVQEYALRRKPNDDSLKFDLAYYLAGKSPWEKISYSYYDDLSEEKFVNSYNNMAILAGTLQKENVGVKYFQESSDKGNVLASSNLANRLIDSGYLSQASAIISAIEDEGDHGENISDSKTKLLRAQRILTDEVEELSKITKIERQKFQRFAKAAVTALVRGDKPLAGQWSANSPPIKAAISDGDLDITMEMDKTSYRGTLKWNGVCFDGSLAMAGTTLLGGTSRRILVTVGSSRDSLESLLWESNVTGTILAFSMVADIDA